MRKVHTFENTNNGLKAAVYRDAEWNEYRVRFYRNGLHQVQADYMTDNKQDALATAETFIQGK